MTVEKRNRSWKVLNYKPSSEHLIQGGKRSIEHEVMLATETKFRNIWILLYTELSCTHSVSYWTRLYCIKIVQADGQLFYLSYAISRNWQVLKGSASTFWFWSMKVILHIVIWEILLNKSTILPNAGCNV